MAEGGEGIGLGALVGFAVTLAFYEVVGLGIYLGTFHTGALLSLVEAGALREVATAAPGVVLARPDARAVAVGLALFAGTSAFVRDSTPGVDDLYGPDAPSGMVYPFYVLQVGLGILLGTAIGAAFGTGLYLVAVHTDALGVVAESPGPGAVPGAVLGVVAANPDALVGTLVGGALGFRSGYTGRIWASSGRSHHGHADGDFDGGDGGFGGGFGDGGGGGDAGGGGGGGGGGE